jgi:hypothetical protein
VTTDDLALFLTVVLVLVIPLLVIAKRSARRVVCREYESVPPNSLEEWRRRAAESQRRSEERR